MGWHHRERLMREAGVLAARAVAPQSAAAWEVRRRDLRAWLMTRLNLQEDTTPIDLQVHRTLPRNGYRIDLVSYASGSPAIRVTAACYIPDGPGPFPAVLNLHGHWPQGKQAARVQERGHVLAQNGFVVLSPDVPGSGERSFGEAEHRYHGGAAGAGLYLIGDSLTGWQVRDNRRSIDVLAAMPCVDPDRIGVTGASGGGNQTMWIAACDDRVKACVPVVSVGTFEAYVTTRNCICETLPGGLARMEEWELLGLVAPKPMLLLNAYKDSSPAFGAEPATRTTQALRDLYALWQADDKFDARIVNVPHGYWPEMLAAMLGWMKFWLKDEGHGLPCALPLVIPEPEAAMLCFKQGTWPAATQAYAANKETLLAAMPVAPSGRSPQALRSELAACVGFKAVQEVPSVDEGQQGPDGVARAVMISPEGTPLPLIIRESTHTSTIVHLIIGAEGKNGKWAATRFAAAETAVALDLPGVGELAWELAGAVGGAELHDTARACLWLGYTLAGEWAACIVALVRWAQVRFPGRHLKLTADREAALSALIAAALDPTVRTSELDLTGLPESLIECYRAAEGSMVMMLPGILKWGDLQTIRQLASD